MPAELARRLEHTALGPAVTRDGVLRLCREAAAHAMLGVCVAPSRVALARATLDALPAGGDVAVVGVVGFPHGDTLADIKAAEAARVVEEGAREVDMVLAVGAVLSGNLARAEDDVAGVVAAVRAADPDARVKVILETALLSDDDKRDACALCERAGAHFVKTSTGFAGGGATVADVALLRAAVGDRLGVKAAGGIRDLDTALALLAAGADRLGCSASPALLAEAAARGA